MFLERINDTPFCTPEADILIPQITTSSYKVLMDKSLVSTIRALLPVMMEEGDSLHISHCTVDVTSNKEPNISAVIEDCSVSNDADKPYQFHLVNLQGDWTKERKHLKAWISVIDSEFLKYKEETGWMVIEKLTRVFEESKQTLRCFVNNELKSTILFTNIESAQQLHLVQYPMPAYFPWYFMGKEQKLSERSPIRKELCLSLGKSTSADYTRILKEIAKEYDFRGARVKNLLKGFERRIHEKELESVQDHIRNREETFRSYQKEIENILKERSELVIRMRGLESILNEGNEESEVMEYFLQNRSLRLENVDNDNLTFVVTSHLNYWDADEAEGCIANENSSVYSESDFCHEDTRLLATAAMVDRALKVRICAAYRLSLRGSVSGLQGYGYSDEYDEYLPNPHIDSYGCLGDYRKDFNQLMMEGNYIAAIEKCTASAQSLNISDPSANVFFRLICKDTSKKYFETPDGTVMTAREAIQWLKEAA